MLKPTIMESYDALSQYAADILLQHVRSKPDSLFCLASGGTPTRTYSRFVEQAQPQKNVISQLRAIKLDEWGGLAMDDPASCEYHLRTTIIDPLCLNDRYYGFESQPIDPVSECRRMTQVLETQGPIDVCVLGLGVNGHLGFNEPAAILQPHAHIATLSTTSLTHAMLSATTSRPTFGLTLGMADLLGAREVILLVSGPSKREPLGRLLRGEIDTQFPASLLVLHPNVRLLCDRQALTRGNHFR